MNEDNKLLEVISDQISIPVAPPAETAEPINIIIGDKKKRKR